jgi:competence protein ComEC
MLCPLVPVAVVFAFGVFLSSVISFSPLLFFLFGLSFGIASIFLKKHQLICEFCVLLLWGFLGALAYSNAAYIPKDDISSFSSDVPRKAAIHAKVVDDPLELFSPNEPEKQVAVLEVAQVRLDGRWRNASGLIRARIPNRAEKISYADELLLEGMLFRPSSCGNPGQYDWKASLARQKIYSILSAPSSSKPVVLSHSAGQLPIKGIIVLRKKLQSIIDRNFDISHAGLLKSLLLGERASLDENLKQAFVETGTMHLLVISGFNVGLIAMLLELFLRMFFIPFRIRLLMSAIGLGAYCMLTGMQPPVLRATVMAYVVLCGLAMSRPINWPNTLSFAAIAILLIKPFEFFEPGFQLSFGAVASLIAFSEPFSLFFGNFLPMFLGRLKSNIALSLGGTTAVWVGLWPVLAWYFHLVSPVSLLANLILVPMVSGFVALGSIIFSLGLLNEFFVLPLHGAVSLWLNAILACVTLCHKIKFGFFPIAHPSTALVLSYYIFLVIYFFRKQIRLSLERLVIASAVCINIFLWAAVLFHAVHSRLLEVRFLDVGHGDSIFIRTPKGQNILVDTGTKEAGEYNVLPFLKYKGISSLDALILTHADEDHIGGALSLMRQVKVGQIFTNGFDADTKTAKEMVTLAESKNIHLQGLSSGDVLTLGGISRIIVLHPPKGVFDPGAPSNAFSLALRLEYGKADFLLCGDIGGSGFERVLESDGNNGNMGVDVIGIPHHGSDWKEYGRRFLDAVDPKVAMISVGSLHNLPSKRVISDLNYRKIPFFLSVRDGSVLFSTDGERMSVSTFRTNNSLAFDL